MNRGYRTTMHSQASTKIRIHLVDDHLMFRTGLKRVLADAPDIEVTGEASDGEELLQLLQAGCPDLVLLDLSLPGKSGLALIEDIHGLHPDLPVLVLSMHDEPATVRNAFRLGALGYIIKTCDFDILVDAIHNCYRRQKYVAPSLAVGLALFEADAPPPSSGQTPLSKRELQILNLIAQGKNLTQIGSQLGLSRKTISAHKSNIKLKLGATTDIEFYRLAAERTRKEA